MAYIWLCIILLLTFIEFLTVNLTTVWFIISAIVSIILTFITDNILIQFGAFVIIGILLLITTRPVLKKYLDDSKVRTNIDRVIGMKGIVTEDIDKNSFGEVKVDGKLWTAMSDKTINKGSIVEILKIDGVKLIVKEKKEEN
ncbi:MAG TPA: NfeD family protein [Tenericutes bacterium]|nr:NfeD family protein [Mycoplasmatota bacterium]